MPLPPPEPGALPAYLRIAERLTIEISAGLRAPGERLPPERRMAEAHGVSPMTLRKALDIVTQRGLVERRQGSGNYVRAPRGRLGTYAFFGLERVEGGGLPTARLLSIEAVPAPPPLAEGHATRLRRCRALDGLNVALEEIHLHARYGLLDAAKVSESLYLTYSDVLGLVIARVEDRVGMGDCPDWATDASDWPPGRPMPLVERQAFDQNGVLAETSRTWFDPERARYVARLP